MAEPYHSFAAILELLQEHDVLVTEVDHNHDYGSGDMVAFDITVEVDPYNLHELAEDD